MEPKGRTIHTDREQLIKKVVESQIELARENPPELSEEDKQELEQRLRNRDDELYYTAALTINNLEDRIEDCKN